MKRSKLKSDFKIPSLIGIILLLIILLSDNNLGIRVDDLFTEVNPSATISSVPISKNPQKTDGIKIIKIIDGDTIKVENNGQIENVRFIGIDTPETNHPQKKVECFGREATDRLTQILSGQTITLEADNSQSDRDRYSRLLRYVFLSDGTNVNKLLVSEGFAHEYTYDDPYKYQVEFRQAQQSAKDKKLGLWGDACQ